MRLTARPNLNAPINRVIFSLRQFLALPFLGLFLLVGSVLVGLFYENSLRMGRQVEQQLAVVLNGRIDQYLEQVFAKPVNAVKRGAQFISAR